MSNIRDFKGIWIPKEVWLNSELTIMEKIALIEINSYDNNFGCVASNSTLSKVIDIKPNTFGNLIRSLEAKGYIKTSYDDMRCYSGRVIKVIKNKFYGIKPYPLENQEGVLENQEGVLENQEGVLENQEHSNTFSNTFSNTISKSFPETSFGGFQKTLFETESTANNIKEKKGIDLNEVYIKGSKVKHLHSFFIDSFFKIHLERLKVKYQVEGKTLNKIHGLIDFIYDQAYLKTNRYITIGEMKDIILFFINKCFDLRSKYFLSTITISKVIESANGVFTRINESNLNQNGQSNINSREYKDHVRRSVSTILSSVPDPRK